MLLFKEHRLIGRKASDFSYTGPKINTRNAEINVSNQEIERAKSLLAQQATAANTAQSNPLMFDGSYMGVGANPYQTFNYIIFANA